MMMKTTFEMSLYPLQEEYKPTIIGFIKALHTYESIDVNTTAMSTYVTGDFKDVMSVLTKELELVFTHVPKSAIVIKIIPMDLEIERGFLTF